MAWLGEELPDNEQAGRTLVARCVKDLVEERLFARRRDLFTDLSVVFMDTTSLYFEGEGGATLGERGHSKDYPASPEPDDRRRHHRPARPADLLGDVARQHRGCDHADPCRSIACAAASASAGSASSLIAA